MYFANLWEIMAELVELAFRGFPDVVDLLLNRSIIHLERGGRVTSLRFVSFASVLYVT